MTERGGSDGGREGGRQERERGGGDRFLPPVEDVSESEEGFCIDCKGGGFRRGQ